MRGVILAFLVVTASFVGCVDLTEEATRIEAASIPAGTLATYEIQADGNTTTETFVFANGGDGGWELWAHNLTQPGFRSPFLSFGEQLSPRAFNWSGLFDFPLEPGKTYSATAGGADATVELERAATVNGSGSEGAIHAVATSQGETVAEFTVLPEPTVLASIQVDTPDGTRESWTLTELRIDEGWNDVPQWEIGDWWTYNATSQDDQAIAKLIYNAHDRNRKGVLQRVLNPQTVESRFAALPMLRFRDRDVAPQSGVLSGVLSSFWQWPLHDGDTWTGDSTLQNGGSYRATVTRETIQAPGDVYTTAYTIEARSANDPGAEPFASWQYAPLIGHLTHFWVQQPGSEDRVFDWELLDWGEGFHGEIEYPRRTQLYNLNMTSGPVQVNQTFESTDRLERLQVKGTAVRRSGSPANLTLSLEAPEVGRVWERNGSGFSDRVLSFTDNLDPVNGTWRFLAEAPEGVSFFVSVRGLWVETEQVDYR